MGGGRICCECELGGWRVFEVGGEGWWWFWGVRWVVSEGWIRMWLVWLVGVYIGIDFCSLGFFCCRCCCVV